MSQNKLITDEGKIQCPRCNEVQDLLAYTRLQQLSVNWTVPLIKCKLCKFVFGLKG